MEQYDKADDYFLQALTVYRQISQGADNVDIANTLFNLAINYRRMEQYNKAEDYYLKVLAMYRQISQGADSVDIAKTLNNLGYNHAAAYQVKRSMETSSRYLHEIRPTESKR